MKTVMIAILLACGGGFLIGFPIYTAYEVLPAKDATEVVVSSTAIVSACLLCTWLFIRQKGTK